MKLYAEQGGRRKLHYSDAFHVAVAIKTGRTLVTSDGYIIEHTEKLGIKVIKGNMKNIRPTQTSSFLIAIRSNLVLMPEFH